jgi:hypothetical protein
MDMTTPPHNDSERRQWLGSLQAGDCVILCAALPESDHAQFGPTSYDEAFVLSRDGDRVVVSLNGSTLIFNEDGQWRADRGEGDPDAWIISGTNDDAHLLRRVQVTARTLADNLADFPAPEFATKLFVAMRGDDDEARESAERVLDRAAWLLADVAIVDSVQFGAFETEQFEAFSETDAETPVAEQTDEVSEDAASDETSEQVSESDEASEPVAEADETPSEEAEPTLEAEVVSTGAYEAKGGLDQAVDTDASDEEQVA